MDLRKNKKNYKVSSKQLIENLLNRRLINFGKSDGIFEVNFYEFATKINWNEERLNTNKLNLPSIWYDFIEIITGWKPSIHEDSDSLPDAE